MNKHVKEMQQIIEMTKTEMRLIEQRLDSQAERRLYDQTVADRQLNGNEPNGNESITLAEQVTRLRSQLRAMAEAYQGTTQFIGLQRQVSKLENRTAELERTRRGEVEQRRDLTRRVTVIERRLSRASTE
jgi:hypothetical protein